MGRGLLCLQFYVHSKIKFSNLKRIFFDTYTLQKASDFFATFPQKTLKLRFLISQHRNKISQRNRRKGFFFIISRFFYLFKQDNDANKTSNDVNTTTNNEANTQQNKKQFFIFKICAKLMLLYHQVSFRNKTFIYFVNLKMTSVKIDFR